MKPTLDRSAAPLLVVTFHPTITVEEVRAHFQELGDAAVELGRVGVVVDLSDPPRFTLPLGQVAGKEMRAVFARDGADVVGVAHVTRSAPARAMLAAVQWLAPPPFPTLVTSSHEEARAWVAERLDRELPFEIRAPGARRDARIAAGLARALVSTATALGLSIDDEELRAAAISRAELSDLDSYVPYGALLHLMASLAGRAGEGVGLRAGAGLLDAAAFGVVDAAAFGIVGLAARASSNLGDALARMARYVSLVDENTQMALSSDRCGVRIVLDPLAPLVWPRPYAELFVAALLSLSRAWTGVRFPVAAVGFRHAAPGDAAEHAEIFGRQPVFGAGQNFVVIPEEMLARPFASGDPMQARYFDRRLDELTRSRAVAPGPLAEVRIAAQHLLPLGTPTIASIGDRLGLSSRTLQRRLNERGVTFGDILDSVRREAALAAVMRPGASVQEMATLSGFADVKAFRRSFLRWTGHSPSEYRKTHH